MHDAKAVRDDAKAVRDDAKEVRDDAMAVRDVRDVHDVHDVRDVSLVRDKAGPAGGVKGEGVRADADPDDYDCHHGGP